MAIPSCWQYGCSFMLVLGHPYRQVWLFLHAGNMVVPSCWYWTTHIDKYGYFFMLAIWLFLHAGTGPPIETIWLFLHAGTGPPIQTTWLLLYETGGRFWNFAPDFEILRLTFDIKMLRLTPARHPSDASQMQHKTSDATSQNHVYSVTYLLSGLFLHAGR